MSREEDLEELDSIGSEAGERWYAWAGVMIGIRISRMVVGVLWTIADELARIRNELTNRRET